MKTSVSKSAENFIQVLLKELILVDKALVNVDFQYLFVLLFLQENNLLQTLTESDEEDGIFDSFFEENKLVYSQSVRCAVLDLTYSYFTKKAGDRNFKAITNAFQEVWKNRGNDDFSQLFEALLDQFLSRESKYTGEFIQPKNLTVFMSGLVETSCDANIYNPFSGLCSFGLEYSTEGIYYAQEKDKTTSAIAVLRFSAHNLSDNYVVENESSISKWNKTNTKFDLIISHPPFSGFVSNTDSGKSKTYIEWTILEGLEALKDDGKMVLLINNTFLYAETKTAKNLRKHLINNALLEMVISLPSGILSNTVANTSIIVIDKAKEKGSPIQFYDSENLTKLTPTNSNKVAFRDDVHFNIKSKHFNPNDYRKVEKSKIINNDYNLSLSRYFLEDIDGVPLKELFVVEKELKLSKNTFAKTVKISNLSTSSEKLDITQLDSKETKHPVFTVQGQGILVATIGENLKPTILNAKDYSVCLVKNVKFLKPKITNINLEYVAYELNKEYATNQVNALSTGTIFGYRNLRVDDLLKIKIKLPDLEIQNNLVQDIKLAHLKQQQEALVALKKEYGIHKEDEQSFMRHSLATPIKNANDAVEEISKIIGEIQKSEYSNIFERKADNNTTLPLKAYLNILSRELEVARDIVSVSSLEVGLANMVMEKVSVFKFIQSFSKELKSLKGNDFIVDFEFDKTVFKNEEKQNLLISCDKELLKNAFNNIVENAIKHGFKDLPIEQKSFYIGLELPVDRNTVVINFSNSGFPMPEGYTLEQFIRKGSQGSKVEGKGYGGYLISKIVKAHNGKLQLEEGSKISKRYVSTFQIELPVVI
ncbi:N-6 DNA methylase [Jejuia pallidilutea]|uniref:site-specific DNA-methyltransferase (adenine-specific) n=3 Tax=Jejuia pallidilutea TaxID=504487 RepID=A0A090VUC4_9FLAO|nr:N-6 DNA methylase [Jejuia pallidilutea]GAL68330.1 type I restriction-modification system DNA-methyltransferase subunit M [Jejuia pallidilutea]GAL88847.1 type I restriction-modification system DNA-methyltransferase subunit M [Jejuia pallidilutea]